MASLSTTQQVLAALGKACNARNRILHNSAPTCVETVDLPAQRPLGQYRQTSLRCKEVAFSICGSWLAAVVASTQQCSLQEPAWPETITMYEVVMYNIANSLQQEARICTGSAVPILQWSQAAPHLGIAQQPQVIETTGCESLENALQTLNQQHPAGFVVDAPTGAVLHRLSLDTSARFGLWHGFSTRLVSWSPLGCQHLVVYGQKASEAGFLTVINVLSNKVVAGSSLYQEAKVIAHDDNMHREIAVAWHPTKLCIVLGSDTTLQDAASFMQAGIAVWALPHPFFNGGIGFSTDGNYFVGCRIGAGMIDRGYYGTITRFAVLSCSIDGPLVQSAVVGALAARFFIVHWQPASHMLVCKSLHDSFPVVVGALPELTNSFELALHFPSPVVFSPSRGFFVPQAMPGGMCIVAIDGGQKVWGLESHVAAPPEAAAPFARTAECSTTTELSYHRSIARSIARSCHAASRHGRLQYHCHGWLQSGEALLCSDTSTRYPRPSISLLHFG